MTWAWERHCSNLVGFRSAKKHRGGFRVFFGWVCVFGDLSDGVQGLNFSRISKVEVFIWNRETVSGAISGYYLGVVLKYFLFSSLFGEMIQFYRYFSNGLKPATSYSLSFLGGSMRSSCG